VCDIAAHFDSPPAGFQSNPSQSISVSLTPDPSHSQLTLGSIVTEYVGKGLGKSNIYVLNRCTNFLDALDVNVASLVPQAVQDVVDSITIDVVS
jgi:hypothetical protein